MAIFEVEYVSFTYTDEKGNVIEKNKTFTVSANDEKDAENIFLNENIKHKKINSIKLDNKNCLGNICPELLKLRDFLK
jgi:hypothetical protein